jgi:signal transduction histidine kinase
MVHETNLKVATFLGDEQIIVTFLMMIRIAIGEQIVGIVKIFSIIAFLISIYRYFLNKSIIKSVTMSDKDWILLRLCIWGNAICWGVIFNTATFELQLQGIHFIVLTTFLAGFIGASIVSLSFFRSLFIPFQLALLLPQIFIITYFYFTHQVNYLPLVFLYIMYLLYQLKLFTYQHKEFVKLFKYQISLENTNVKLKTSQQTLMEQTVQLVHTSRLGALGEMSAGFAHEVNNPLTIIKSGVKLLSKELDKEKIDIEALKKSLEKIDKSTERIARIVNGLKNLSNQADNLPSESVSLLDIVEETSFFCSEILSTRGIKLELDPIPNVFIFCHPVQISQVIINLVKNAADYLDSLSDSTEKWIKIEFNLNQESIDISITNGGEKIPAHIADKLFDPFFTTKPVGKGTGLGLSISQKIIKEHQGELKLDLSNKNTCFVISMKLPC